MLRRPVEPGQYTSIVYSERLTDQGVAASIGSVGDAYDNSMAEAVINTYKHELLRNQHSIPDGRRWKSLDELYLATVAWLAGTATSASTQHSTTAPRPSTRISRETTPRSCVDQITEPPQKPRTAHTGDWF